MFHANFCFKFFVFNVETYQIFGKKIVEEKKKSIIRSEWKIKLLYIFNVAFFLFQ
jgi:hypothetical protein